MGCFVGHALPFGSDCGLLFSSTASLGLFGGWVWSSCCRGATTMTTTRSLHLRVWLLRQCAMIGLVKLLGFQHFEDKMHQFGPKASMLGVEVDCGTWQSGHVVIRQ